MSTKSYLQKIIEEETSKINIKEEGLGDEHSEWEPDYEGLIQDPIGGMVRPDQIKKNIIYDLRQCLRFAEHEQWEFRSLLLIIDQRIDAILESQEDLDDEE